MVKPVIEVLDDGMRASLSLTRTIDNDFPSVTQVKDSLVRQGIIRGVSIKAIENTLERAAKLKIGEKITVTVAKGLPARMGKDAYIKPLVPNVIEKFLLSQKNQNGIDSVTDATSSSDLLLVKPGQAVAQRIPPTRGRDGFTVKDKKIASKQGNWTDVTLGKNTRLSKNNENIIVATKNGQPKFEDGVMSIFEAMVCSGVTEDSGPIEFDGTVIVDGNVEENMQIIATDDVIVTGFVESALIRAGGDISILQGATGRMDEFNCQLFANGNIVLHHGQGLDVVCGKQLQALKQLAYSRIVCHGKCIVGQADFPDGALFASKIKAYDSIKTGIAGAVSGSELEIDFTDGFKHLNARLESVRELRQTLQATNQDHENHVRKIDKTLVPEHLIEKINALDDALASERSLLNWITNVEDDLHAEIDNYTSNANLTAQAELYPGVSVILDNQVWSASEEYLSSIIAFEKNKWVFEQTS